MTREAINELKKYTLGKKNTEKVEISVLQLNRVIKALEHEPKTGHWITLEDGFGNVVEAVCSNCDNNGNHKWKWCPNCGTKMVESREREG